MEMEGIPEILVGCSIL